MRMEQKITMEIDGALLRLTMIEPTSQEAMELRSNTAGLILKRSKMTIGELAEEVEDVTNAVR